MTDIRIEIEAAIGRVSDLINAKDVDLLAQFDHAGGLIFVGSELLEIHRGLPDVEKFFRLLRDAELSVTWRWDHIDADCESDVVWFLAHGNAYVNVAGQEDQRPYRLSGVLVRRDGVLKWRQFHGSEPRM